VEVFDIDDAMDFLFLRSGIMKMPAEMAECVEIVKELGYLPLAIEKLPHISVRHRKIYSNSFLVIVKVKKLIMHGLPGEILIFIRRQLLLHGVYLSHKSRKVTGMHHNCSDSWHF
jgi:hypothetical protein